jgi:dipeptidyl aminopeptidase/acylaminoacyl peptidase
VNPGWQDRVVAVLPGTPTRLLLDYTRLHELDLDSGRLSRERIAPVDGAPIWFADRSGDARLVRAFELDEKRLRTLVRNGDDTIWTEVATHRVDALPVFVPLTGDPLDAHRLYAIGAGAGGTLGLYGWTTTAGELDDTPIAPLRPGLLGVVQNPQRTEIYGLRYLAADGIEWLDPAYAEVERRVAAALPNRAIRILSVSDGLRRVVVGAGAENGPGDYYVYDRQDGALLPLGSAYRNWPDHPIAAVRAVQISGADGERFDAYLSAPAARVTDADRRAAIVIPRADGFPHDFFDFDPLVQILNQRGYAVLQLHDRRRLRFPDEAAAELYDWTPAPPDDVLAATDWLVGEGFAPAGRVCVVGLGFGGYTALMAAAVASNRYACVVSANGPTNLDLLAQNWRYLALPVNPEQQLSPVNRADTLDAPVLLVHGADNKLVAPDHARSMRARLERLDHSPEYLELEAEDHELSTLEAQAAFLRTLLAFVGEHLD